MRIQGKQEHKKESGKLFKSDQFEEEEPVFEDAMSDIDDSEDLKDARVYRGKPIHSSHHPARVSIGKEIHNHIKILKPCSGRTNSPDRTRNVESFNKREIVHVSKKMVLLEDLYEFQPSNPFKSGFGVSQNHSKLEHANTGSYPVESPKSKSHVILNSGEKRADSGPSYNLNSRASSYLTSSQEIKRSPQARQEKNVRRGKIAAKYPDYVQVNKPVMPVKEIARDSQIQKTIFPAGSDYSQSNKSFINRKASRPLLKCMDWFDQSLPSASFI